MQIGRLAVSESEVPASPNHQTIIGKLDIRGQQFRIAGVEDVVVEVSKERAFRLEVGDVCEGFFETEMCGVRFDADAVEHEHIEIA